MKIKNGKFYDDRIKDYTKYGECSGCGECCSRLIPLSSKEINTIKKYMQENNIKINENKFPFAGEVIDMRCPFLNKEKENRCTIYEVRPLICREFSCYKFKLGHVPSKEVRTNWAKNDFNIKDMVEVFKNV